MWSTRTTVVPPPTKVIATGISVEVGMSNQRDCLYSVPCVWCKWP